MKLIINSKPFSFKLTKKLITSQGIIYNKVGLLLQIKDSDGNCGWGEISPIEEKELKNELEKEFRKNLARIDTSVTFRDWKKN